MPKITTVSLYSPSLLYKWFMQSNHRPSDPTRQENANSETNNKSKKIPLNELTF